MRPRSFYWEIFLISLAVILVEISYTRIFSFKFYYFFTYLIIGISMLGLGAGGVFVAIFPRLRAVRPQRLILICRLASSLAIAVGYFVIALVQLKALTVTSSLLAASKLGLMLLFLFVPFLGAGVVIATIFGARPLRINRLYCADLVGAALGCVACIPLMYLLTPPGCVMFSALILATCALRLALEEPGRVGAAVGALIAILALPVLMPSRLPDPRVDPSKTLGEYDPETSPVVFSQWSSVFRVDVMQVSMLDGASYLIVTMGRWDPVFIGSTATCRR